MTNPCGASPQRGSDAATERKERCVTPEVAAPAPEGAGFAQSRAGSHRNGTERSEWGRGGRGALWGAMGRSRGSGGGALGGAVGSERGDVGRGGHLGVTCGAHVGLRGAHVGLRGTYGAEGHLWGSNGALMGLRGAYGADMGHTWG